MTDIESGKQEAYTLLEEHDQFTGAKLNLNSFLAKVYKYYNGKGLFCMMLARILTVIAYGFLLFWVLFLAAFVDYEELFTSYSLPKAVKFDVDRIHPVLALFEILFGSFWLWMFIKLPLTWREYWEIRTFYRDQLHITSSDLQWMRWSEVTQRLSQIKELSWSKEELTALDIANIIMRRENYWIALTNHNVLALPSWTMSGQIFEWGVTLAVFDLLTSPTAGVRLDVLRSHNDTLTRRLAHRSRVLGVLGLVLAPFVLMALLATALARYGPELRSRPSALALRGWTGHARWMFRDFNELPHYCDERLDKAHKPASKYIDSFQSYALTLLVKFALFVLGAVLIVFIVLSLINDTVLTRMEIIPGHWTAIMFLGVLGSAFAVVRGLLPDEPGSEDPNELMLQVAGLTHQLPDDWIDRAHTFEVRDHFSALFQLQIVLFLQELFSVLTTPLLLLFVLPKRAQNIVDFFNEFTVFHEGLGPVCKFATFDLSEHGNKEYGATKSTEDTHKQTKHGKLEMSIVNFKAHYPEWQSRDCEELLQRATEVDEEELLSTPMDRSTMTRTLLMHKVAHNARSDPSLRSHYYPTSLLNVNTMQRSRHSSSGLSPVILESHEE